jgi:branched-chain amino acid transport system permease protein
VNASIVVSGLTIGSIYALIAVGINILYRPTKVFNFAQGCLAMLGSMIGLSAFDAGLKWWAVPPLVFAAVGVISLIEDQVAVAPVLAREPTSFTWLITTLGFAIVVQETAGHIWDSGPNLVNPPSFLPIREHNFGWVQVSAYQVFLIAIAFVVVALVECFYRMSKAGRAVLAVAEDRDAAVLRGINPRRLTRWSFVIGGSITGLAGLLGSPVTFASIELGPELLITAFIVTIVGGIGDNRGALIAGLAFGIVGELSAEYVNPGSQDYVTFGIMLLVLMIRPQGLFGRPVEVRIV